MKIKKSLLISLILLFVLSLGFSTVSAIDSDNLNNASLADINDINENINNINENYMQNDILKDDSNDLNDNLDLSYNDFKDKSLDSKIGSLDSKYGSLDSKIGSLDSKIGSLDSKDNLNNDLKSLDNSKSKVLLQDNTNTIYVSLDGSDDNDGLTKDTAVASISKAVSLAGEGYTIYLTSGSYTQSSSTQLSKALSFIGEDGTIVVKGGTSNIFTYTSDTIKTVSFKNIIFSSTVPNPNNPILSMAGRADLVVDNCTVTNAFAGKNGILRLMGDSTGRITNTKFLNLTGSTSAASSYVNVLGNAKVKVDNCLFANSSETFLLACVYVNNNLANLTLTNTVFTNISGNLNAIVTNRGYLTINNCSFTDNSLSGNGPRGIVWSSETIYNNSITYINSSVFSNNSIHTDVAVNSSVIQAKSPTVVEYSAFLNNDVDFIVNNDNQTNITANYNWWGTNQNPKNCSIDLLREYSPKDSSQEYVSLVSDGVDIDNWAIMAVEFDANDLIANENYPLIININQYMSENGDVDALQYGISDVEVLLDSQIAQFNSSNIVYNGSKFNQAKVILKNGTITVSYNGTEEGSDELKIISGYEEIIFNLELGKAINYTDIYVSKSGSDSNDGLTNSTSLATIEKAISLAKIAGNNLKIHINEGIYAESGLELNDTYIEEGEIKRTIYSFIGYGNVVIDGNGQDKSIFSIRNNSVSFKNIRFTNVNGSMWGGAIDMTLMDNAYNRISISADLTVNNCTFDNLKVKQNGGAILYNYVNGKLTVNNTKFYNLSTNSSQGGAIYVQEGDELAKVKITNSNFRDNFANNAGAMYLRVSNVTILNSKFINNTAKNYPGAISFYNASAIIESCVISNNSAKKDSAAIKIEEGSGDEGNIISIRSCIIENNTATDEIAPAINVSKGYLNVSYSSLVNELSISTRTYSSKILGNSQGVALANNNWWGVNNPFGENEIGTGSYLSSLGAVVNGSNITIDSWVILNMEFNDTSVLKVGNIVNITLDFNHVNTSSGEILLLSGGKVPKDYTLRLNATGGRIKPSSITTVNGIGNGLFTVQDTEGLGDNFTNAYLDIKVDNEIANLAFEINNYKGVIFLSEDGNDDRNGSMDAPVKTLEKAIQLALDEDFGSHEIFVLPGTYEVYGLKVDYTYLSITGSGVSETVFDGAGYTGGIFSIFDGELVIKNLSIRNGINTASSGGAFTNMGNLTLDTVDVSDCQVKNVNGGVIYSVGNLVLINSSFTNNKALSGDYASGGVIYMDGYYTSLSYPPSVNITDCVFDSNSAGSQTFGGGAIYMQYVDGFKSIKNTKFINNKAIYGGAIFLQNSEGNFIMDNLSFIGNKATGSSLSSPPYGGGALNLIGKTDGRVGNISIINSVFIDNSATNTRGGGAILDRNVDLNISNSVIYNNKDNVKSTQIFKDTTVYFPRGGNVIVEDNWWGVNNLNELTVSPANLTINRWVVMNLSVIPIEGANVGGANVVGANVGGANVGGANVGGANVGGGANINDDIYANLDSSLHNYLVKVSLNEYNDGTLINSNNYYPFERLYSLESTNGEFNQSSGTLENNIGTAILSSNKRDNLIKATIDGQSLEFSTDDGFIDTLLDIEFNQSINVNDNLIVVITLTDIDNNPINGTVIVKVYSKDDNGNSDVELDLANLIVEKSVNVTGGSSSITIDGLNAGDYTVLAEFNQESQYLASDVTKGLEVSLISSLLKINDYESGEIMELYYGSGNISGTLTGENGPIANQNVSLIINENNSLTALTDEDGKFTIDLSNLAIGNYADLLVSFDANEVYEASSTLLNINVNKISSVIDASIEEDSLIVSLKDENNISLANKTVSIKLSDDVILNASTNESGHVVFDISSLKPQAYETIVSFASDDYYESVSKEFNFTIDKYDASIFALDVEGNIGSVNLTAGLTGDGNILGAKNLTLNIANQTFNAVSGEDGIAVFDLSDLKSGDYDANIIFDGDELYKNASFAVKVTVNKLNPNIASEFADDKLSITVKYEDVAIGLNDIGIEIIKHNSNGSSIKTTLINATTDNNGLAILDLSDLEASNYTAVIRVYGNDKFNSISKELNFTIDEKIPPKENKTVEDLKEIIDNAKDGDVIVLADYEYVNVSDINITKDIVIIGNNTTIVSAGDGKAIFNIADGLNNVSIKGIDFKLDNDDVLVKVNAKNGTKPLSIEVPAIEISGNAIGGIDDSVATGSITVLELNSERSILAPNKPIVIVNNTLDSGIKAFKFNVEEFENSSSANIPIGGNVPAKQATIIEYQDMNTTTVNVNIEGRVGKYFEVNLTDANGNPLADKLVQIGFNGKIYNRTTNATGGVSLQINLAKKGTYTFAISFLGDEFYNASFAVSKITVSTQKTKLTTVNKSYKANAKTKTLTATLKSGEYNKAISGKTVTFTVNGKSYTAKTNSKGVASVKVSLSLKKTYSFTVKYAGDDRYTASSVKGKVVIK